MSPVNLELKVKGAVLVSGMDGEDTWFTLRLACSPTQESGVLEIGDRYVFAATNKLFIPRENRHDRAVCF